MLCPGTRIEATVFLQGIANECMATMAKSLLAQCSVTPIDHSVQYQQRIIPYKQKLNILALLPHGRSIAKPGVLVSASSLLCQ